MIQEYPEVKNFIGGRFHRNGQSSMDVINPQTGKIISTVPLSGKADLDLAVKAAKDAFPGWSSTPIKERVQIFYRYKALMEKHMMELSEMVKAENGKTLDEARAEVEKSIELTEFACSLPQMVYGEVMEVSKGVECRFEYKPMGVVASLPLSIFRTWYRIGPYPMPLHLVTV